MTDKQISSGFLFIPLSLKHCDHSLKSASFSSTEAEAANHDVAAQVLKRVNKSFHHLFKFTNKNCWTTTGGKVELLMY